MSRGHVELVHAPELPWGDLPAAQCPAGVRARVLSRDAGTAAVTAVVSLPAGWRRPAGHVTADVELLVLSGALRIGARVRAPGYYEWAPAGTTHEPWTSDDGCELIVFARTGAPDWVPAPGPAGRGGRIEHDTEAMEWTLTPIPGPPAGICLKILRHTDAGEVIWLSANSPDFAYDRLEFHDVVEESYCISGDIWLGNSGTMRAGSTFWRPPYVTHGPFYSRSGRLAVAYCAGPLVNHFVDDPRSTPEANRARAEAEGPPADWVGKALAER